MTLGHAFDSVLAGARAGEAWAWTELYRDLAGPVRGYLAGRRSPDPEDEAAETFLQVARGLHSFSGDEAGFRAWVFSIAHRRMVDAVRRKARRPEVLGEPSEGLNAGDLLPSAEEQALLRDEAAAAAELLEGLTPDQRDVLLLRVVGDLSVREASLVLGKSESAVKVTQHRALTALRRRFSRQV